MSASASGASGNASGSASHVSGPSALLSAMYQERLLAEYRAPKNRRDMPGATARAERTNPICGDAIGVMVHVTNDVLRDVSFTGHGCSLAVASADRKSVV